MSSFDFEIWLSTSVDLETDNKNALGQWLKSNQIVTKGSLLGLNDGDMNDLSIGIRSALRVAISIFKGKNYY